MLKRISKFIDDNESHCAVVGLVLFWIICAHFGIFFTSVQDGM